ncbi:MAG: sugar ABC transporter, partial [Burkholderiales bacterium PBB5]
VQQFGTPDDIYSRPATRFVAEFIGSPAMNLVTAQRAGDLVLAHGVELATNAAQRAALQATGPELSYGLRPEHLAFADAGLPGTLAMIEPTGPETYVTVDTAVGKLTARVPGNVRQAVGERVHLQWAAEQAHLFDAASGQRLLA